MGKKYTRELSENSRTNKRGYIQWTLLLILDERENARGRDRTALCKYICIRGRAESEDRRTFILGTK